MYAGPSPSFCARWSTSTKGSSAASRSASSPVPSGEPSSITSTRSPSRRTLAERVDHRLEVLELVVGRQADGRAHRARGQSAGKVGAYDRRGDGSPLEQGRPADELGAGGPVRPPRRPDGARGRRLRSGSRAYRKAAARIRETGSSVAQLALDGRAKELQGIGKTIEEKIVQAVEDGEIARADQAQGGGAAGGGDRSCASPGSARRRRGRLWQELGITTVADLRAAAEAQQLRGLAGLGREVGGEDPRRARPAAGRPRGRSARCSGRAAEAARRRGRRSPRTRPRSRSRSPARPGASARRCATST